MTTVLDQLGIPSAHFWGFSMGGWIGFGMAKYADQRLKSLTIGGASPYARIIAPASRPDGNDPEAFVNAFFELLNINRADLSDEALSEFTNNDFLALAASLQDRPPLEGILPSISVPCLLYVGDNDGILEQVKQCATLIPESQLVVLPGLDHPQSFYEADQALSFATPFLDQASAQNA